MTWTPARDLLAPEVARDAVKAYGQALATLSAAEAEASAERCPRLERELLEVTGAVLACRVRVIRALLDSGARLPREEIARLHLDEQLLALPRFVDEAWVSTASAEPEPGPAPNARSRPGQDVTAGATSALLDQNSRCSPEP